MARDEYEQLEFQRQNPHLFTTLTQCVNADGTLTTFDHVTSKLREAKEKMQGLHSKLHGGPHPDFCMRGMESDVCKAIEYYDEQMGMVQGTFIRSYHQMRERMAARREREIEQASPTQNN